MGKEIDRLCYIYKYLGVNEKYSDDYLTVAMSERTKTYENKKQIDREEVFHELDALLKYLESGLFGSYYASKSPKRIIDLITYSFVDIQKVLSKEDFIEVLGKILKKLREIYREIRRHPHNNGSKFGPIKKAIQEVEGILESLNAPKPRRKIEKGEMSD